MDLNIYLNSLIPKIYKCIPLKDSGELDVKYLETLNIEINGSFQTFPELNSNSRIISVINTINYFKVNDVDFKVLKREIFKCISEIEKIVLENGGTLSKRKGDADG